MGYTNLHLLILGLAVVCVQAVPVKTMITDMMKSTVEDMVKTGMEEFRECIMNTNIMKNIWQRIKLIMPEERITKLVKYITTKMKDYAVKFIDELVPYMLPYLQYIPDWMIPILINIIY